MQFDCSMSYGKQLQQFCYCTLSTTTQLNSGHNFGWLQRLYICMSTKEQVIVECSCGRSIWWCTGDIETVSLIRRRLWTWNVLICLSHRTRNHTQTATTTAMHSQPLSLGYLVSAPVWSIFVDNHPSTGLLVVAITGIIYSRLHWLGELSKGNFWKI